MTLTQSRRGLDEAHDARLNFDPSDLAEADGAGGWHIDDYCRALPAEAPGPPVPGGSWTAACRLMRDCEFADPKTVRAVCHSLFGQRMQKKLSTAAHF